MSAMSERDAESRQADYRQEQEMQESLRADVQRVVDLACRHLTPTDEHLLRWFCGCESHEPDPRQMAVWSEDGN